jgi:hypothetical protein
MKIEVNRKPQAKVSANSRRSFSTAMFGRDTAQAADALLDPPN